MTSDGQIEFDGAFDPLVSVRGQWLGSLDPTYAADGRGFWHAANTPDGPVTVYARGDGKRIRVDAWGPGTEWALERMPRVCGADDPAWNVSLEPAWLDALARQHARMQMGQALQPADLVQCLVLQQRVRTVEAAASWRRIVRRIGTEAPGPTALRVPPTLATLRSLQVSAFASFGVDAKRARTLRELGLHGPKLARRLDAPLADLRSFLPKLPGIGPWTTALWLAWGFGDADAVPTGDYHLPNEVVYAFTRRRRGTDEEMLALLEPYRGYRYRILRLLSVGGPRRPRGGPRLVTTPL